MYDVTAVFPTRNCHSPMTHYCIVIIVFYTFRKLVQLIILVAFPLLLQNAGFGG
jgi:hypothetical protein